MTNKWLVFFVFIIFQYMSFSAFAVEESLCKVIFSDPNQAGVSSLKKGIHFNRDAYYQEKLVRLFKKIDAIDNPPRSRVNKDPLSMIKSVLADIHKEITAEAKKSSDKESDSADKYLSILLTLFNEKDPLEKLIHPEEKVDAARQLSDKLLDEKQNNLISKIEKMQMTADGTLYAIINVLDKSTLDRGKQVLAMYKNKKLHLLPGTVGNNGEIRYHDADFAISPDGKTVITYQRFSNHEHYLHVTKKGNIQEAHHRILLPTGSESLMGTNLGQLKFVDDKIIYKPWPHQNHRLGNRDWETTIDLNQGMHLIGLKLGEAVVNYAHPGWGLFNQQSNQWSKHDHSEFKTGAIMIVVTREVKAEDYQADPMLKDKLETFSRSFVNVKGAHLLSNPKNTVVANVKYMGADYKRYNTQQEALAAYDSGLTVITYYNFFELKADY